jgi:hypothetical protein
VPFIAEYSGERAAAQAILLVIADLFFGACPFIAMIDRAARQELRQPFYFQVRM